MGRFFLERGGGGGWQKERKNLQISDVQKLESVHTCRCPVTLQLQFDFNFLQ